MSGSGFIGKWKGDMSTATNYEEFCKASGLEGEMIEKFRNDKFELEFKKNGDNWTCDFKSGVWGAKTYEFQNGVEVTTTDPMGKGVKYTVTFESDTTLTEVNKSELANWIPMTIKREIKDGKIYETTTLESGVSMTSYMTKA